MNKSIRIISPAGVLDAEIIQRAANRLQAEGFAVEIAPHATGRWGRFAGTPEQRTQDAVDALTDPEVGLVLCTRGGYGMQQIIDKIEQGVRSRGYNGAAVWGFSDITELHQLIARLGGASVHGIMCKPVATLPDQAEPWQAMLQLLHGEAATYTILPHPLNREGEATGIVRGGNMAVLCGLSGTDYDIRQTIEADKLQGKNTILFIEDVGEHHYKIDRMLHQLRMSGVLDNISGLVVGQFADCDDDEQMQCTLMESIAAAVEGRSYPVLFGFPAGHVEYNLPLVLGKEATLKVTKKAGCLACSALPLGLEPRTP